jgi:hypothetical protein
LADDLVVVKDNMPIGFLAGSPDALLLTEPDT